MLRLMLVLALTAGAAKAEEWRPMTGTEIAETLTGQVLEYDNAWQDFRASGRTLYNAGRDSRGYWAVRDDKYCSMWPPSDLWACYEMEQFGNRVRFVDATGDVTEGTLK